MSLHYPSSTVFAGNFTGWTSGGSPLAVHDALNASLTTWAKAGNVDGTGGNGNCTVGVTGPAGGSALKVVTVRVRRKNEYGPNPIGPGTAQFRFHSTVANQDFTTPLSGGAGLDPGEEETAVTIADTVISKAHLDLSLLDLSAWDDIIFKYAEYDVVDLAISVPAGMTLLSGTSPQAQVRLNATVPTSTSVINTGYFVHSSVIKGEVRIFTLAQTLVGGFDPAVDVPVWSALQTATPSQTATSGITFTPSPILPAGSYRAYTRLHVTNAAGSILQTGAFTPLGSPLSITVIANPTAWLTQAPLVLPAGVTYNQPSAVDDVLAFEHDAIIEIRVRQWNEPIGTGYLLPSALDGAVTMDRNRKVMSTISLSVANQDDATGQPIVPYNDSVTGLYPLHPYGKVLEVVRGVRAADGTEYRALLGVFIIERVELDEANVARVDGRDYFGFMDEGKYIEPLLLGVLNHGQAIHLIASPIAGTRIENHSGMTAGVDDDVMAERTHSRLDQLHKLAAEGNAEAWADVDGVTKVWRVDDDTGQEHDLSDQRHVTKRTMFMDRAGLYDVVFAFGPTGQVGSAKYDDGPLARPVFTYPVIGSSDFTPYAKPFFYASPSLTTTGAANTAAATRRNTVGSRRNPVTLRCVPNPWIRPRDEAIVIDNPQAERYGQAPGSKSIGLVESVVTPLSARGEQYVVVTPDRPWTGGGGGPA